MKFTNKIKTTLFVLLLLVFSTQLRADGPSSSSSSSSSARALPDDIPELVESEKYDEAIAALNAFISDESRNPDAWNYLGYSQRKVGLLDKSLTSYKKALKLDRKHLGAHEYLGELYLMMGKPKKANKQLKRLAKYCGDCEEYQHLKEAIQQDHW